LLDGVLFGFEREDDAEAVGDGVDAAEGFLRVEDHEFGEHEGAEHFDFVLVVQAGDDAVEEVPRVDTRVGVVH